MQWGGDQSFGALISIRPYLYDLIEIGFGAEGVSFAILRQRMDSSQSGVLFQSPRQHKHRALLSKMQGTK